MEAPTIATPTEGMCPAERAAAEKLWQYLRLREAAETLLLENADLQALLLRVEEHPPRAAVLSYIRQPR